MCLDLAVRVIRLCIWSTQLNGQKAQKEEEEGATGKAEELKKGQEWMHITGMH